MIDCLRFTVVFMLKLDNPMRLTSDAYLQRSLSGRQIVATLQNPLAARADAPAASFSESELGRGLATDVSFVAATVSAQC